MKILYLSFYYPPDFCAGSFRNGALIKSLTDKLDTDSHIDVLTTFPHRYGNLKINAFGNTGSGKIFVRRVQLPAHKNGMIDQARNFLAYARFVREHIRGNDYDLVFASSSRLMTAVLGAWAARKTNALLYLDIRDIFLDSISSILSRKISWLLVPFFSAVERWTFSSASRINLVSEGFLPYFDERYPSVSKTVFTNGIDDDFLLHQPLISDGNLTVKPKDEFEILYAGNIGEGQGLHNILPALALKLMGKARFRIIGAGGRLAQLELALEKAGCSNVLIEQPVDRSNLITAYKQSDVLFLHLNDYSAFLKVLPSKLFEYGAMGKPILAGVAGYSCSFIKEHLSNAEVFTPCDSDEALLALHKLEIISAPRTAFSLKFSREVIMDGLAIDVLSTVACYDISLKSDY